MCCDHVCHATTSLNLTIFSWKTKQKICAENNHHISDLKAVDILMIIVSDLKKLCVHAVLLLLFLILDLILRLIFQITITGVIIKHQILQHLTW